MLTEDVDVNPYISLERGVAPLYRSPQDSARNNLLLQVLDHMEINAFPWRMQLMAPRA